MHVRCPDCRNAIEVVGDSEFTDVDCPSCGSSFNLVPPTEGYTPKLRTIGHFQLLEQLGVGTFGSVWKAKDTELDRLVAVKVPRRDQIAPEDAEMFLREARAAAQLNHPQIVAVHEVGRDNGSLYIVSDLIRGVTLADRLTAGPMTPREAAELCVKIGDALHHAHEAGVIHRDLKPQNIMLDGQSQPHIMDFGLAKRDAGEVTMTVEGKVLGTAAYMSPEQARGEGHRVDRRTDVYSLGVILFELLTGERPFRGNARMLLHQVVHDEPPSPRRLNSRLPRDLETIVLKCLEKDPRRRYATATDVAEELRRWLAGHSILARPISKFEHAWRWSLRNPVVAGLTGGVIALLAFIAIISSGAYLRAVADATAKLELAKEKSNLADKNARLAKAEQSARLIAEQERDEAHRQERIARAQFLAAESQSLREQKPIRAMLLALKAVEMQQSTGDRLTSHAIESLRDAIARTAGEPIVPQNPVALCCLSASSDGKWLAAGREDGKTWLIQVSRPDKPLRIQLLGSRAAPVRSAIFSPDGRWLATCRGSQSIFHGVRDGDVILWDLAESGAMPKQRKLVGHTMQVNSVLFLADGKILTAGDDGSIREWSQTAEREFVSRKLFESKGQMIGSLASSADGRFLVAASYTRRVYVWVLPRMQLADKPLELEVPSFEATPGPKLNRGALYDIQFAPDDRWLAVRLLEGVAIYSTRDEFASQSAVRLMQFTSVATAMDFSPDSRSLWAATSSGQVQFLKLDSLASGAPPTVVTPHRQRITSMHFSKDGTTLITVCQDGSAQVTSQNLAARGRPTNIHDTSIEAAAFAENDSAVYTAGKDGSIRRWPLTWLSASENPHILFSRGYVGDVQFLSTTAGGSTLITGPHGRGVRCWDLAARPGESNYVDVASPSAAPWKSARFCPTAGLLAVVDSASVVNLWDLRPLNGAQGQLERPRTFQALDVAISPDGNWLAGSQKDAAEVNLWDLGRENARPRKLSGAGTSLERLEFSPDGRWLAACAGTPGTSNGPYDSRLFVWDLTRSSETAVATVVNTKVTGSEELTTIAFDPESRFVFAGSSNSHIIRWQLANLAAAPVAVDVGQLGTIHSVMVSPDGKWVAWCIYARNKVSLVSLVDFPRNVLELDGGNDNMRAISISPDSRWLAGGGNDGRVVLWDLQSRDIGRSATRLSGQTSQVNALCFTPDSKRLIAGGEREVRVWTLDLQELIELARVKAGRELTLEERAMYDLAQPMRAR